MQKVYFHTTKYETHDSKLLGKLQQNKKKCHKKNQTEQYKQSNDEVDCAYLTARSHEYVGLIVSNEQTILLQT